MVEAQKPRKLAVGTMVRFAYRNVFGRLELILELGWIMLLALLAAAILPDLLLPGRHAGPELKLEAPDYLQAVIALLALTAFSVRWHQSILLGDPRRQPTALFFRGWWRFLLYACIVYAVLGAIVAVTAFAVIGGRNDPAVVTLVLLLAIAASWAVLLATARLSLLFPAAACGRPLGFGGAWRLMRGNVWRLIGATILTVLPIKLITFAVTAAMVAASVPQGTNAAPIGLVIIAGLIETGADILLAALGASLLSGFYRELVAWNAVGSDRRSETI